MNSILSSIRTLSRSKFFWIVIVALGLMGWLGYRHYRWQSSLVSLVEKLKAEVNTSKDVEPSSTDVAPVSSAVCTKTRIRTWMELQALTKDTVAQVIAEAAQFNWLEPYKSPEQGRVSGSAFFINDSGELITNAHVVIQAKAIFIQIPSFGKRRLEVDLVGISPERDLALIRLRPDDFSLVKTTLKRVPALTFGDSDKVSRAEEIMTLGYPLGQQSLKSTAGVISGREHINGQHMIQMSAPINPGSSGGPAINHCGQVIGVNTAQISPSEAQNVNYIIPSNEVKLFLAQVEKIAHVDGDAATVKLLRKPFLGVIYNNATEELTDFLGNPRPGGLYVVEAFKDSPLFKAGIKAGDMVYEVDGHKLDIFGDMNVSWSEDKISITDYISRLTVGDSVHLKVYRAGKPIDATIAVDQMELAPVRLMYPEFEKIDYEIIGGMVIMSLALNHVPLLLSCTPLLAKYADPKNQLEPAVIITHVMPDSAATRARSLGIGAVISEVNGKPVTTLDEFRSALLDNAKEDIITLKSSDNVFTALSLRQMLLDEKKLSTNYYYKITDTTQKLMQMLGIV